MLNYVSGDYRHVIGRIDDPDSDRSYTIELIAARIKDRCEFPTPEQALR